MAKKPISQKRAEKEELENRALHRVFNVFLLGLAAECYLFLVYRGYAAGTIDSMLVWHQILTWGMYAGLVMLVAGAAVVCQAAGRKAAYRDALVRRDRPVSGTVRLGCDVLL